MTTLNAVNRKLDKGLKVEFVENYLHQQPGCPIPLGNQYILTEQGKPLLTTSTLIEMMGYLPH